MALGLLSARYRGEGNANDTTGSNNGTLGGSGTTYVAKLEDGAQAFSFNGSGYLEVASPANFDSGNNDFTYMALVKIPSFPSVGTIVSTGTANTNLWRSLLWTAANNLACQFYANDIDITPDTSLVANEIYFIAWLYDSATRTTSICIAKLTGSGTLWTCVIQADTGVHAAGVNHTLGTLRIASQVDGGSKAVAVMDDIRLYKGKGTLAELQAIVNSYRSANAAALLNLL